MNSTGFLNDYNDYQKFLWAEGAATATKIENMIVNVNKHTPAYWQFFGKDAPYASSLQSFSEIGIMHKGKTIKNKLDNQGIQGLFLRYADHHGTNVYCMLNLKTQKL